MGLIRINQMGYAPNSEKRLIYIGNNWEFQIYDEEKGCFIFNGKLEDKGVDEDSLDRVKIGDFSALCHPGKYRIYINDEKSDLFTISGQQLEICTDALLKAFYYQRCGMELTEEFAGPWCHLACHLQPSYIYHQEAELLIKIRPEALEQIDTSGGWHDAGDYGRYTVAAAKAVADLLLSYEQYKEEFLHSIHIPESCEEGADLLHEVKFELDFLFKMQSQSDGSVYTKVATRYFPGMIMPELDTEPLLIFDTSSPATADFTAVMAMAYRVYKEFDSVYAEKCLAAAKKAYEWLRIHKEPKLFHNPSNVWSGEYGDKSDLDERYWAAAELYRSTGEEIYHEDFLAYYSLIEDRLTLGWGTVSGYGTIAYLFSGRKVKKEIYDSLVQEWIIYAKELVERSRKNGYGITLKLEDYKWGSNMILMNQAIHLILAQKLQPNTEYASVVQNNWDYLLGRNPMDISYVSGLGERAIMHPHHRPSTADNVLQPIPGLVSGGPCAGLIDNAVKEYCTGNPPAKCFVDMVKSYSTNEIAIYWNSPSVYVGAYLCSRAKSHIPGENIS